jgi:hypothetical protein
MGRSWGSGCRRRPAAFPQLAVSSGARLPGMSCFDAVALLGLLARGLPDQRKLVGRTVRDIALRAIG